MVEWPKSNTLLANVNFSPLMIMRQNIHQNFNYSITKNAYKHRTISYSWCQISGHMTSLIFTYSSLYSILRLEREKSSVPKNITRHGGLCNVVFPLTVALEKVLNLHLLHCNTRLLVKTNKSTFSNTAAVTQYSFGMYFPPTNLISTFITKTEIQ